MTFAGAIGQNPLGDTWEWNGANWIQLHPTTSPPKRASFGMVWDAALQRIVIFGGASTPGTPYLNDTWAF